MPCKSFVSDFSIVEKTFAFYEKILFSKEKTFAIFRFTNFEGRNFRKNGKKSRKSQKFLPEKVSAPKAVRYTYTIYFQALKLQVLRYTYKTCNLQLPNNFGDN